MYVRPTVEELVNIIHSGGNEFRVDKQQVTDIHFLIQENYLCLSKVFFGEKIQYEKTVEELYKTKKEHFDLSGGSVGHMALKKLAKNFFSASYPTFIINVEDEFMGYRPDILIEDSCEKSIYLVECGNTESDKFFKYFTSDKVKRMYILPYPEDLSTKIFMFTFTPTENTQDFLLYLESERRSKIKSIVNQRTT